MTHVSVIPFSDAQSSDWDAFCADAVNATFLHTRRFLSYHGSCFEDASVCVLHKGQVVGVIPAAREPSDSTTVCSHPGITYGGLVTTDSLTGARFLMVLEAVAQYYADKGFTRLLYKAVPHIYHRRPAQDDLYALQRMGAHRYFCQSHSARRTSAAVAFPWSPDFNFAPAHHRSGRLNVLYHLAVPIRKDFVNDVVPGFQHT